MKKSTMLFALFFLAAIGFPLVVQAQDEDPPNLASLFIIHPKDGQLAELEAATVAHGAWRKENGDPRAWQMYQAVTGDDLDAIYVHYCCFEWADEDAYEKWQFDTGAIAAYAETMGPHVESLEHYYSETDSANSNWPEDPPDYYYFGVTYWKPNPANQGESGAALAKFTEVAKENGWPYPWSWSRRIGGSAQLSLISPYQAYSSMDRPGPGFFEWFAAHTSEQEAAEAFEAFGSGFWSSEYTIYRWRPDLSMSYEE